MSNVFRFKKLSPAMQRYVLQYFETHGYQDFASLAEELRRHGYQISKSSLHRLSQTLRSDAGYLERWALKNPEQAAALVAIPKASPDGRLPIKLAGQAGDQ